MTIVLEVTSTIGEGGIVNCSDLVSSVEWNV
jgi:hypothetical protein